MGDFKAEDLYALRDSLETQDRFLQERISKRMNAFLETIPEGKGGGPAVCFTMTLIQWEVVLHPKDAQRIKDWVRKEVES